MSNSAQRKRDAVQAAMSVASDVTEGLLDPAALEAEVIKECRQLVGKVIGPEDALWGLQCEIARGVLAAGGIPGNELAEWAAVQRQSEPLLDGCASSDHPLAGCSAGDDELGDAE